MDMLLQNFPKTKHPYDTITMGMILAPSFAAVVCNENVHLPTLLSDLVTLMLVAWVVRFLSNWPERWVKHLKQVRTSLLNFVNSVKIEIGQAFFLPEMALNRRVFVSNLVAAQRLLRFEQLAWLGGIGGTLAGAALMLVTRKYLISPTDYRSEVFGNSTILLYVVWSFFKLALQYLDSLKSSITFTKTATVESTVTENNLLYYIEMFCLESPVVLPTMSPKKPKEEPPKERTEPTTFCPKQLNMKSKNPLNRTLAASKPKKPSKMVIIPEHQPVKLKEPESKLKPLPSVERPKKSVSFTPFPLTGSGSSFRKRDAAAGDPLATLSPIAEDQELAGVDPIQTEPVVSEPSVKEKPKKQGRVSVTGITIPETSNPSITRQQFREWHLKDMESLTPLLPLSPPMPLLPLLPLKVYRTEDSDEVVGRMRRFTDVQSQKVQNDWKEVRSKLTDLKESCYESAWQYAESVSQMDMLELFTLWFFIRVFVFVPIRLAMRVAFLFFRLPFMVARLYVSITLFIPVLIFKIAVLAPARLFVAFLRDSSTKEIGFHEYRMAHLLPVLKDRVTLKLLRKFLRLLQVDVEDSPRSHPTPVELL